MIINKQNFTFKVYKIAYDKKDFQYLISLDYTLLLNVEP